MDTKEEYGTIPERVARGLVWIQEHGAAYGIDLARVPIDERLMIQSPCGCVLGWGRGTSNRGDSGWMQVKRDLWRDADETLAEWPDHDFDTWAYAHGFVGYMPRFVIPDLGGAAEIGPLQDEWRRVLDALDLAG